MIGRARRRRDKNNRNDRPVHRLTTSDGAEASLEEDRAAECATAGPVDKGYTGDGVEDEGFDYEEPQDPYTEAAAILAGTPNPVAGVAVVLGHLMNAGILDAGNLSLIGIDAESTASLKEAFDGNNSIDSLVEDLATAADLRTYRRVILEISEELGIMRDDARRDQLKSNLAGFALENNIEDLRIAYRLMRVERPDLLP